MRICHFSDSHLGAGETIGKRGVGGLTARQEDIIRAYDDAISRIISLKPDVCLHSGDLFHQVRPSNRILAVASAGLNRLASEAGIPTIIITGNHDAPRLAQSWAALEVFRTIDNLRIASSDGVHTYTLGDTTFQAVPHSTGETSIREFVESCQPIKSTRHNVLITHGVVAGMPEFAMAELGEQEFPIEILNRFDYVALGHYHNFARVAERAYYAGSTERLSQSERDFAKGFVEIVLDPFDIRFHEVPSRGMATVRLPDMSGKRGDEIGEMIAAQAVQAGATDNIVRLIVPGISRESLKTLPSDLIAELKKSSFALDIRFESTPPKSLPFSATLHEGIGRLDEAFVAFLDRSELSDEDKARLRASALQYLRATDEES
jgi:DNA repair protein SbcD/Mre11